MTQVEAVKGDITTQPVDAIVNAANSTLLGGGGVDGAIHAAAGPALLAECREVRRTAYPSGLPVGYAVVTGAGDLPCRWVVHTVGPNWHRGERAESSLVSCFRESVLAAAAVGARSVALPAVSAGVYGWAGPTVARLAVAGVAEALADLAAPEPESLPWPAGTGRRVELVRFVLFNDALLGDFEAALAANPLGGLEPTP
ncbi:MAG: macro domain-containing protein [Dermatophilaceae bacterium]|nr:macro domain-containing protein [Dermatophilaceae bacterium]MBP9919195.1 macro domain-containing protein [Dermatophilaceae bacterium]